MGLEQLTFLARDLAGFSVRGSQVKVILEPKEFYQELLARSAGSRKRIILSALYLGTGPREQALVSALEENLRANSSLRVRILLDWCRGTRLTNNQSSATLLAKLASERRERCAVAMYHTPHLRGLYKSVVPAKWNETIGLQHCKVYVFDDSLIISGANLSSDYFENRQDRYILVENCPKLADYYEELISTISNCSLQMDGNQEFSVAPSFSSHPFQQGLDHFVSSCRQLFDSFLSRQLEQNSCAAAEAGMVQETISEDEPDTWIFPSIQMGPLGVTQDSELTVKILQSGQEGGRFRFGSGYFNLTDEYLHQILHGSRSHFDIIMAHPKANGFLGARGAMGGIPHAYTHIARTFWDLVTARNMQDRISMFEYQRPNWTFHAKGLWYYQPGVSLPCMTMVGSPNFGYRSVYKDLETQLTLVTRNPGLQSRLHQEQERLLADSQPLTASVFNQPGRIVPTWVKMVVGLARNYF